MYHILSAMNDKVCSLRPFSDNGSANDWIPHCSIIVYSILAIIQVLRAQSLIYATNIDQFTFLQKFLDQFPLQNLEIPGPLVPFFRSLSISQPGFGDYEAVGPAIPSIYYSEATLYSMTYILPNTNEYFPGIDVLIPNIPLMLDQFRHLLTFLTTLTAAGAYPSYSEYVQLSNLFGMDVPANDDDQFEVFERHLRTVGFSHRPTTSDRHMLRFAHYYAGVNPQFPSAWTFDPNHAPVDADPTADPPVEARAENWTLHTSLADCLGFESSTAWFHILLRGMPTFTKYFKGNTRLSDISPTSSAAAMILFKGASYAPIVPRNPFTRTHLNRATHELLLRTYAISSCPDISDEDFQDAQMAQVNVTCTHDFGGFRSLGQPDVTHFGDFWQVPPARTRTNADSLVSQFMTVSVSPAFFQDPS